VSDIFEETEEDLRAQKWVDIVKASVPWVGAFLVAALILALASWGWQSWQEKVRDTASENFQAALDANAKGDTATAKAKFDDVSKHGNGAYKAMALMELAGMAEADKKTDEAVKDLDAAAKATGDPVMSDLAALKAAYLLMDKSSFADIQKRLSPLAADKRPLSALAKEALAMAKIQAGDIKGARADLQVLSVSLDAPDGVKQRASLVMDAIDSGAISVAQAAVKLPEAAMPQLPQMMPGQQMPPATDQAPAQ